MIKSISYFLNIHTENNIKMLDIICFLYNFNLSVNGYLWLLCRKNNIVIRYWRLMLNKILTILFINSRALIIY